MNILPIFKLKVMTIRREMERQSKLKILVVTVFTLALLIGEFYGFFFVFKYLERNLQNALIDYLLYFFFMVLFFMLVLSNIIVSLSTLYKPKEVAFLFSLPIKDNTIFISKSFDTFLFSSWVSIIASIPLLLAYGITKKIELGFYIKGLFYIVLLAVFSTCIGIGITLILKRVFRKVPIKFFILIGIIIVVTALSRTPIFGESVISFSDLLPYTKFSKNIFLPSYWIVESLISNDNFWIGLVIVNVLFFGMISFVLGEKFYSQGFKLHQEGCFLKRTIKSFIFKIFKNPIIAKDITYFSREPQAYSQFLIFFGILACYFISIRNLDYIRVFPFWKDIVTYLNFSACTLTLASLSVRFIFPQISIEGKNFWVLLPVPTNKLIWTKFWLNGLLSFLVIETLLALSNFSLKISYPKVFIIYIYGALASFGIVGLSLGFGAIFPDFKSEDSAKIVSGFGGTFTLLLSLFYVGSITLLLILKNPTTYFFSFLLFISFLFLPMIIGERNLRRLEI